MKDTSIDFSRIIASPIVHFSGKATFLIRDSGKGNIMVYPIFLRYQGNDDDFRLDYFNNLKNLEKEGKLPRLLFFSYVDTMGNLEEVAVGEELFEVLVASTDYHNKLMLLEEALKKYPSWFRPFMRISKLEALVLVTIWILTIANVIAYIYVRK